MSKRIEEIGLGEFGILLDIARIIHSDKNEPIPQLEEENWNKIAYALHAPFQVNFGRTAYRGFLKKASILFYLIAKGHRLSNGNKRMACTTLSYFCTLNDKNLVISDEELVELARYTAASDSQDKDGCFNYIVNVLREKIVDQ